MYVWTLNMSLEKNEKSPSASLINFLYAYANIFKNLQKESVDLIENQAQIKYHAKLLKMTTLFTEEMEAQRKKSWATFQYYLHSDSISYTFSGVGVDIRSHIKMGNFMKLKTPCG